MTKPPKNLRSSYDKHGTALKKESIGTCGLNKANSVAEFWWKNNIAIRINRYKLK